MLALLLVAALANEPPPPMVPRFEITPPPSSSASFPNGFRLQVQDSGEEAVTVATWVSGGSPAAARSAAELFYARTVGGLTVREAYQQMGASSEALVYGDGTLFVAVGPAGSLAALLTLEGARFSTSDGKVDARAWGRAAELGSPWVREQRAPEWTEPLLSALYPEPHPYHPSPAAAAELDEARAFARELYLPEHAATLVLGDLDELARLGVIGAFAESFGEEAGELAPPAPAEAPALPPSTRWLEAEGEAARIAVGWRLPGLDAAPIAELEATRLVVEHQLQGRAAGLRPRCLLEPGLVASTLVCAAPIEDPAKSARLAKKLARAVRPTVADEHLQLAHGAWAQQRMAELASASWQPLGAARTTAPLFGLTGELAVPEAASAEAVQALIAAHLGAEQAVSLVIAPAE